MKKTAIILGLLLVAFSAQAAITVGTAPTSLVSSATTLAASTEKAVFEFALTADAAETLSSVGVTVNSSTASSSDFANVSVFRDDGDGVFDSGDTEIGTQSTVNVGSVTTVNTASNNTLTGGKFFVVLETSSTWSGSDAATVSLGVNGITTSSNSPTTTLVTTANLGYDITCPSLQSAVAMNMTGGTSALDAGDQIVLTFNEATNKGVINTSNVNSTLSLNNSHTWLDVFGNLGSASWNDAGTVLTLTLSTTSGIPTIVVGDTVSLAGSVIQDTANNNACGSVAITGSFGTTTTPPTDEEEFGKTCSSGIVNGRIYKTGDSQTVYLAAACKLRPFRGAAVFHARGYKFQNIITLSSLAGIEVSNKPALPAGGTLVQGSDSTVWFVTKNEKRKGFVSEQSFKGLGFSFGSVKKIADSDLATMEVDAPVTETSNHPEGSIIKCGNSSTVFEVRNNSRFPFTNPSAFLDRGHSWDVIANVDCGRFSYLQGTNLE
jgi:hypothetical protein